MKGPSSNTLTIALLLLAATAAAVPPTLEVHQGTASGSLPKGVSISPDGATLYVSNFGNSGAHSIAVFDTATLRRTRYLALPGIPVETAISPDGNTLYASNFRRNSVHWINLRTGRATREVTVGSHPKILTVSHDGRRLFAANWGGSSVTELDANTGNVVRTLRAGRNPRGMAITRAGTLYVANFNSHNIDVYEGTNLERHTRWNNVCRIPRHLVLSPDESNLYVSCFSNSEVLALDPATGTVRHRVRVGEWPKALDVSPDGRYIYTANYGGSSVSIIDTTDWNASTIDVPSMDHASGIVAARTGVGCFVTGWYDGMVYRLATGAGAYRVSDNLRALTLRRREFHRTHPVE